MFKEDKHVIAHALSMWANYLETGDVAMSSKMAKDMGRTNYINIMTNAQKRMVLRLRAMIKDQLNK